MILVDTSVWVDHFREPIEELDRLAAAVLLVQHPFVTGELALGTLKDRGGILAYLSEDLLRAQVASEREFLTFVVRESLAETGIGFVDAHLLAACQLSAAQLWTRDKRLRAQADALGISWEPS